MKRKRLLIDVDEVICDFQTPAFEIVYRLYGKRLSPFDFNTWNIFEGFSDSEQNAIYKEINKPGYCSALAPMPGAIEAVRELRKYVDVYPVTSPVHSPTWVYERYIWLQKYFGFNKKEVIITGSKFLIAGDALLDDNPEHVTSWLEEYPDKLGMLWDIPNTHLLKQYDRFRVYNWEEVIKRIVP